MGLHAVSARAGEMNPYSWAVKPINWNKLHIKTSVYYRHQSRAGWCVLLSAGHKSESFREKCANRSVGFRSFLKYLRSYALLIQGVMFIAELAASDMLAGYVPTATREPVVSVALRRLQQTEHTVLNQDPTRV